MSKYESIEDEMNAMMTNSHEPDEIAGTEEVSEEVTDTADTDGIAAEATENEEQNDEDTEQTDKTSGSNTTETDTKNENAGSSTDTEKVVEVAENESTEENTRADNSNLTDENESVDGSADATANAEEKPDENTENSKSKDKTETDGNDNGSEPETTVDVDYKKQYDALLKNSEADRVFREKVTSDFKANGRMVKGITDPDKIVQRNQMAEGLSDKLTGYKKFRPFMSTFKKQGWLDDPEKFNRIVDIANGDQEAFKEHMKTFEIDPVLMDMEDIKYAGNNHVSSSAEIVLDDTFQRATANGVREKVESLLLSGEQWDKESVVDLLNDSNGASSAIVDHMSNGGEVFKMVQARINEKKSTDVNGTFGSLNSFKQYQQASFELEAEQKQANLDSQAKLESEAKVKAEQEIVADRARDLEAEKSAKVESEKTRIETERKEAAYKLKVQDDKKAADDARKKATQASASQTSSKTENKKDGNGADLKGADFKNYFNQLMTR